MYIAGGKLEKVGVNKWHHTSGSGHGAGGMEYTNEQAMDFLEKEREKLISGAIAINRKIKEINNLTE